MSDSPLFFNRCFDKNKLKYLISWSLRTYGEAKTLLLVEKLKDVGFFWATQAGISLSLDDLRIPNEKTNLLNSAENDSESAMNNFSRGNLTAVERLQQLIDAWHKTSELLKQEVVQNFRSSDPLNPVYMMAFSGARGNLSQVRQLVGMRGLMADPQGRIIDFPIRSNFREGLTLTEYVISCYGARKGVVDTALRTATSGYLTRRLVDVAHHVVVSTYDCETHDGIFINSLTQASKTLFSLHDRLVGRVLAEDISNLAFRNQPISQFLAIQISQIKEYVLVRSPLTCKARTGVCQLCYGWSLGHNELVSIGEAVGIIAAQSIGEPGTQLTMRTFHTGGVYSGELIDQIESPCSGIVKFSEKFPGTLVRTSYGKIGFLTRKEGYFLIEDLNSSTGLPKVQKVEFPIQSILFVRQGQKINAKELLLEYASTATDQEQGIEATQLITSPNEGEVFFEDVVIVQEGDESENRADQLGSFWVLSGNVLESGIDSLGTLKLEKGDLFYEKSPLSTLNIIPVHLAGNLSKKITVIPSFNQNQTGSENLPSINVDFSSFSLNQISYTSGNYFTSLQPKFYQHRRFSKNYYFAVQTLEKLQFSIFKFGLKTFKESNDFSKRNIHECLLLFGNTNSIEQYSKTNFNLSFPALPHKLISLLSYSKKYSVQIGSSGKTEKVFLTKGFYKFSAQKNLGLENIRNKYFSENSAFNQIQKQFVSSNIKNSWLYEVNGLSKKSTNFIEELVFTNRLNFIGFKQQKAFYNSLPVKSSFLNVLEKKGKFSNVFQLYKTFTYNSSGATIFNRVLFSFLHKKFPKFNNLAFNSYFYLNSCSLESTFCNLVSFNTVNVNEQIINKQTLDKTLVKQSSINFKLQKISFNKNQSLSSIYALTFNGIKPFSDLNWQLGSKNFWYSNDLHLFGYSKVILPTVGKLKENSNMVKWRYPSLMFSPSLKTLGRLNNLQKETGEIIQIKFEKENSSNSALMVTKKDLFGIQLRNKISLHSIGSLVRPGDEIFTNFTLNSPAQIFSIRKDCLILRKATPILFSSKATFHVFHKDFIKHGLPLITLSYRRLTTGDIVQGIPRIEQLFEARQTTTLLHDQLHELFENYKTRMRIDLAARKSFQKIQRVLIDSIQRVYLSQGVMISDKHVEIIVRQMTSTVKILEGGRTRLLRGELKPIEWIERINTGIDVQKAEYEPILLGITKASLETESFISAASFQETTRTLSRAAIEGRTDFLRGLKENVILGHRIPAGTGAPLITYLTKFQIEGENEPSVAFSQFSNDGKSLTSSKNFSRT